MLFNRTFNDGAQITDAAPTLYGAMLSMVYWINHFQQYGFKVASEQLSPPLVTIKRGNETIVMSIVEC